MGQSKMSYCNRHHKEKSSGGWEKKGIIYGPNILLCSIFVGLKRADLIITVYYYLL
jgi:hypothetical protein